MTPPLGTALKRVPVGYAVGLAAVCLSIPVEPEIEHLKAARSVGLATILVPEDDGSMTPVPAIPLKASRLWLVGLDANAVAPEL